MPAEPPATDTSPDASPGPLEREPSPFLLAVARAFLLAPSNSGVEAELDAIVQEYSRKQGVDSHELVNRAEFAELRPEET